LVQACEAYKQGIDIHEYAKDHEELAQAIAFFEKKENKETRHAERAESN
jgi:ribulose-bisphosphate carboxylase large chain